MHLRIEKVGVEVATLPVMMFEATNFEFSQDIFLLGRAGGGGGGNIAVCCCCGGGGGSGNGNWAGGGGGPEIANNAAATCAGCGR
uniref:Candidate secreted effector n=1 Tax=Meloidogyne incognita TaxID=6306 RepID=A0A914MNS7_MELIC